MSVILITADNFAAIQKTFAALSRQTVQDQLELIIVCPAEDELGLKEELSGFHSVRVLEVGPITTTSKARAAAIRIATGSVVALAEAHAYPEPGWAEAMIEAHKQPWGGVGPVFNNANPGILSWVALVVDYGRWVAPMPSGEVDDIPGHNSSWKRSLLLAYGSELEFMLPAITFLNQELQAKGHKLYLESAARVAHLQVSKLGACLHEQFNVARFYPARRAQNWPWYRRTFYACGMPVLLIRHVKGWIRHILRIDPSGALLVRTFPMLVLIALVWGMGEIFGYVFGIGRAEEETVIYHTARVRYVNARDRELIAAR